MCSILRLKVVALLARNTVAGPSIHQLDLMMFTFVILTYDHMLFDLFTNLS